MVIDFSKAKIQKPPEDGWHLARVINATTATAKSGRTVCRVMWKVLEGDSEGAIVFDNLNLEGDETVLGITFNKLIAMGLDIDPTKQFEFNADALLNLEAMIRTAFDEEFGNARVKAIKRPTYTGSN